jgi:hypothetical protein
VGGWQLIGDGSSRHDWALLIAMRTFMVAWLRALVDLMWCKELLLLLVD